MSPFKMWLNSCPEHALQLGAGELVERATRDRDGRIGRRETRRERVDAGLVLEHEDLRHRHAGRDRHLFDDVAQPPIGEIAAVSGDRHTAERTRDDGAAAAQAGDAVQRTHSDRQHDEYADREQAAPGDAAVRASRAVDADRQHHDAIDRDDDRRDRQREQHQHAPRLPPRAFLLLEEVHA